ncbi:enoyl-CoA hydratase/isomerase family protein [Aureibaculum sp. 2210JD6-5]|uniref:enoyl-CoA hydratase/isomerase family protein n=1 Tax=Aureibaculum sp. 2210JD6-5 TaxID=3103957 RepID=UPI002AAD8339|nr:enoyl-CoA hydratase/isomerase family protein [Aureibaculum sp. 2210JD6-5]MDY7396412.1 enoyl-CoA hydratase/isomerase family protein [Aureibaculum sp. 2210JD6-5]
MEGTVLTSIRENIATITFGHPASNSFPSELLKRLIENINNISDDDTIQVIILQSEGDKAFCAGASFDELVAIRNLEEGKQFFSGFANLINAMRTCNKLIIGRVQGKAVGGGVGIIAATDYCFATEKADIKLSELTIGIGPFVIEPAITRKAGITAFSKLSLDATEWHSAYWAKDNNLYSRVFTTTRDMDEFVESLSKKLASYNPDALKAMKKVLWQGTENWNTLLIERAETSGQLVLSDFTKKALHKFKQR